MKHWWKILSVIIILGVIVFGMMIPLKTGILSVSPSSAKAGETVRLKIEGYNSHYKTDEGKVRAWLKLDENHLLEGEVASFSETQAEATFKFPERLPSQSNIVEFTLLMDSPKDGHSIFPAAVLINQTEVDSIAGARVWEGASLTALHEIGHTSFPYRSLLEETIRSLFFHVPLWFGLMIIFGIAAFQSFRYIKTGDLIHDHKAVAYSEVGTLFGLLGLATGAIWAKYTWGAYWSFDIKQNMSAIAMLIYLAYFVLRGSFEDDEKKARVSASYNIFAYSTLIPLLFVIPRLMDSLHPGNGGNPGLGGEDLDNTMRMVFYPAIIGWTLFGAWMAQLSYRLMAAQEKMYE